MRPVGDISIPSIGHSSPRLCPLTGAIGNSDSRVPRGSSSFNRGGQWNTRSSPETTMTGASSTRHSAFRVANP